LDRLCIEGETDPELLKSSAVKISMWTIAALCHDLGYPLEKSAQVIDATKEMMTFFVANPKYSLEASFSGVQDYMNEFILRLISSKMVKREKAEEDGSFKYSGRVQPKYYMKFSKSLEKRSHGIISAVIIYKTLLYFMESDYNVNEDYFFNMEDAKQFYIRRDILRSIASHTTTDIYHMHGNTLSFLLYICDELQEWDRRSFLDFYHPNKMVKHKLIVSSFTESLIAWKEEVEDLPMHSFQSLVEYTYKQFKQYQIIFRDGQDTSQRSFDFLKEQTVDFAGSNITLKFGIPRDHASYFEIEVNNHIDEDKFTELTKSLEKYFGKKLSSKKENKRCLTVDPYRISIK
jgi:hypothetical protein